jgi:elongation of very long chain fatty acids protein 6
MNNDYMDIVTYDPEFNKGIYMSRAGINHTFLFFYEKKFFDGNYVVPQKQWMASNWYFSVIYACIYVVAVFSGQAYMKNREKMDLRRSLVAWNLVLSLFSLFGAVRCFPEFVTLLAMRGVNYSICDGEVSHGVSGHWGGLFTLSKVPELIDTYFIVARKQKLIFLHWYHHTTVLMFTWYSAGEFTPSGRWFVLMNFSVHAVMYGYYAFKAMRFNIPKWVNVTITSMQLSQMAIGIYVNVMAFVIKQRGEHCLVTYDNLKWAFLMYLSYFCLFFHFFYKTYLSPAPRKQPSKTA